VEEELRGNSGGREMNSEPDNKSETGSPIRAPDDKGLPDRALVYSWVLVSDFGPYVSVLSQKCNEIPNDADAGIGYIYIDHDCGISMKVECLCTKNGQEPDETSMISLDDLVSLRFRYSSLKVLKMKKLSDDEVKRFGLPTTPKWLTLYNPPDLKTFREFEWIDPFRAHGFFDDVMAILPGIGGDVPEMIWVRLMRYFRDTDRFHGALLNEPFRDYGVHRNDIIEVKVARNPNGITLVAAPCKVSHDKGTDSNYSGNPPEPEGVL
jgi:hypothetical protein